MAESRTSFSAVLFSLWLRLITAGAVASLVAAVSSFPAMISNWRQTQTPGEILFGILVRGIFLALLGAGAGTVATGLAAPFLAARAQSRERMAQAATAAAVVIAAFWDFMILVDIAGERFIKLVHLRWFPITILYTVAFAVALWLPRSRKQIVTSLDGILGEKTTRRAAAGLGAATAGVIAAEWTLGKVGLTGSVKASSRPNGPNILLISFDALTTEDMSAYGYRLPTTPNISEFAARSSVFGNYYSVSTLTTPCVATMLTGTYPSENRVYHLYGRLRPDNASNALPNLMRVAGYSTGASFSNPFAYYLVEELDFDVLPDRPAYHTDGLDLWRVTGLLHQRQPYGSRSREYSDMENLRAYGPQRLYRLNPRLFAHTESDFAPAASFAQAREVMDRLPDGYFMWVHVMAPHGPYLPAKPWMGRFLPGDEMGNAEQQLAIVEDPVYRQRTMDKIRRRYDEFVAEADSTFGSFLSGLESAGRLKNTAVIVTADHGESFEGGVFGHASEKLTRPQMHIPLIIRMPGQDQGRSLSITADQTSFAPTLLDIAGLPRPGCMRGRSLAPWLNPGQADTAGGLAFAQYLQQNTVFEPLHAGSAGVIEAQYQCVLDIRTGKVILRSVAEAASRDTDHAAANSALAHELVGKIYRRFPEIPHRQG